MKELIWLFNYIIIKDWSRDRNYYYQLIEMIENIVKLFVIPKENIFENIFGKPISVYTCVCVYALIGYS